MVPLMLADSESDFERMFQDAISGYRSMNPEIVYDAFVKMYNEKAERINSLRK